jgi:putative tricarboxylic transport membrane protein
MSNHLEDPSAAKQNSAQPGVNNVGRRASGSDFGAGLVIFLIALYSLIDSILMPYYEDGERGPLSSPGLTPGLLSLGLMIMALVLMFRARGFKLNIAFTKPAPETWRVLAVFSILVLYVALMRPLGYVISTFLMLAAFQFIFARKRSWQTILLFCIGLSALVTGALYYVFGEIFLIPMP